ncbi:MAG: transposase, partial [Pseudomonadota bacterium]|nr:transposase [Pseudomonadota bacterium]
MKTRSISHLSLSEIEAAFAHQAEEIAQLKQQLDWLKRQLFGRKSEKVLADNPAQSSLFDEGETLT